MAAQWYLINVRSQRERAAQAAIAKAARLHGMEARIHEVVVPTHSQTVYQSGKRTLRERISFPGYLLAKLELDNELQQLLQGLSTVRGFVADYNAEKGNPEPTPMAEVEVQRFMDRPPVYDHGLSPGDTVRITEGPFVDVLATVESVEDNGSRIQANVNLFGRTTPIELSADNVAPV